MTGAAYENDDSDGGSLLPGPADIGRILRARIRLILACVLFGTLAAATVAWIIPSKFVATALIYIDSRKTTIVDMDEVVSGPKLDSVTMESEVELIQSSAVIARVVDDLSLWKDREFIHPERLTDRIARRLGLVKQISEPEDDGQRPVEPELSAEQIERNKARAIATLSSMLSAHRRGYSYLIEISYASRRAWRAAEVANAVAEAYLRDQVEAKMRAAEMATAWLDRRIEELRTRVYTAERAVERFKSENSLVDTEGHPLDERELSRQMDQLIAARGATAQARAKYEQMLSYADSDFARSSNADVLANLTVVGLKGELAKARRALAELRTRYGDKHPSIQKALADVSTAEQQLKAEINRVIANLRNEYEVASGREAELEKSVDALKSNSASLNQAMVRLRELEREAAASRSVYEAFLKRAQETAQQQNLQLPDGRVVERAVPPAAPNSPKRMKLTLMGLAGGLGLGLVLAVLIELMSPTLVRSEQIESALRTRHLATVPALSNLGPHDDPLHGLRRIMIAPGSMFAETVRAMRVGLENARQSTAPRLVLVASALPGEGRTVIASNLAHHYAMTGAKTLLIDCDLRLAGLTRRFQPDARRGLLECLTGDATIREAIGVEQASGLHFLPAAGDGGSTGAAAELLASAGMARIVNSLKDEFDIIIADCPPLLPVVDTRILAEHADQILFVLRWRMTPRALAQRALKSLAANAGKVVGVIVNSVAEKQLAESTGRSLSGPYVPAAERAA